VLRFNYWYSNRRIGRLFYQKEGGKQMKCSCGKEIKKDVAYFIRIEPGEQPEIFCEFCVSIN
ncbi:hypothetical protein LCGC14_2840120, partial [marine sediment metagenome]